MYIILAHNRDDGLTIDWLGGRAYLHKTGRYVNEQMVRGQRNAQMVKGFSCLHLSQQRGEKGANTGNRERGVFIVSKVCSQ